MSFLSSLPALPALPHSHFFFAPFRAFVHYTRLPSVMLGPRRSSNLKQSAGWVMSLNKCVFLCLLLVLSSCGGGGSSNDGGTVSPPSNASPVLAPIGDQEVYEGTATTIATLSAADADGDSLTFSLAGADASFFDITAGRTNDTAVCTTRGGGTYCEHIPHPITQIHTLTFRDNLGIKFSSYSFVELSNLEKLQIINSNIWRFDFESLEIQNRISRDRNLNRQRFKSRI